MQENIGVLVASDSNQEWTLPWWWHHYKRCNNLPVTFVDLGLSPIALSWCEKKGKVLSLKNEINFVAPKEKIPSYLVADWEQIYGKQIWDFRPKWFLKPLALSLTPYTKTLYLDTDCEVRCKISPLFNYLNNNEAQIAIARCTPSPHSKTRKAVKNILKSQEVHYNSGVILYSKKSEIIQKYYEKAFLDNHLFPGDQELLGHLLFHEKKLYRELPQKFNYQRVDPNLKAFQNASIRHWAGRYEKMLILRQAMYFAESSFIEFDHFFF